MKYLLTLIVFGSFLNVANGQVHPTEYDTNGGYGSDVTGYPQSTDPNDFSDDNRDYGPANPENGYDNLVSYGSGTYQTVGSCNIETVFGNPGKEFFGDWYISITELVGYGHNGKLLFPDVDILMSINKKVTKSCLSGSSGGVPYYRTNITFEGTFPTLGDAEVSILVIFDNPLEVHMSARIHIREHTERSGDLYLWGTFYKTASGMEGFIDGEGPVDDDYIRIHGDARVVQ